MVLLPTMPAAFPAFTVHVPATTANLGPGFDTLGLALDWFNQFRVEPADEDCLQADAATPTTSGPYGADFPALTGDAARANHFFAGLAAVYQQVGQPRPPLAVTATLAIPLARGLGSSATAVVGGCVAANHLLGQPLSLPQLLAIAAQLEGHADNVAPALLGGCQLCNGHATFPLVWPEAWRVLVVVPNTRTSTEEARHALPEQYSRADAVFTVQQVATLVWAIQTENAQALRLALRDRLHQPYRGQGLPTWNRLQANLASASDAVMGAVISGSGPTVLVVYAAGHQDVVSNWVTEQAPMDEIKPLAVSTRGAYVSVLAVNTVQ